MVIRDLRLCAFRNYADVSLALPEGVTVLHGDNAQGKTNLIEAVHLCCVGRSHRTGKDVELIRWGDKAARVSLSIRRREGSETVDVRIDADTSRHKQIRINDTPLARIGELMGHVNAVLFSPEDLRIVKDGPEGRRRFLDMEISQLQPAYFYALQRYHRARHQRNGLLRHLLLSPSRSLRDTLCAWDEQLVEAGAQVIERRIAYVGSLGGIARDIHASLSGGRETLTLSYQGRAHDRDSLAALVDQSREDDLRRGMTSAGPHRDDIRIQLDGHDAKAYASQGQQRTIALAMKLAEIDVMREMTGEAPVLLLDDVMSELDVGRRRELTARMRGIQTLITCTHLSDLGGAPYDAAYRIENGTLTEDGDA